MLLYEQLFDVIDLGAFFYILKSAGVKVVAKVRKTIGKNEPRAQDQRKTTARVSSRQDSSDLIRFLDSTGKLKKVYWFFI